jgi:hypothetical protein
MTMESVNNWRQALEIPRPLPAWRQLAVQQWLIQERASLQIQSVLASRMNDYLVQRQRRLADRQTAIEEQLAVYENPSGSTQPSEGIQSRVSRVIGQLAKEGPVTSEALNIALRESGNLELPKAQAQAAIAAFYLK